MRRFAWVVLLAGCATFQPPAPSTNPLEGLIGATSVGIETAAKRVQQACGNLEPGGPCAEPPAALITTDQKEDYKRQLQLAQDAYQASVEAYIAGDHAAAQTGLAAASQFLDALEAELLARQIPEVN